MSEPYLGLVVVVPASVVCSSPPFDLVGVVCVGGGSGSSGPTDQIPPVTTSTQLRSASPEASAQRARSQTSMRS